MPGESSNLTFRDLIENILKEGLNHHPSCFVTSPNPSTTSTRAEPPVHTEINHKVIEEFLKP